MGRNILLVENDRVVSSGTLENIVRAANIAGYMEKGDEIDVPDDQQLMQCIVSGYNTWDNLQDPPSWDEFIEAKLLETFGPQYVYLLVERADQGSYTDSYGEEAKPAADILGVFTTRKAAEKEKQKLQAGFIPGEAPEYEIIQKILVPCPWEIGYPVL